MEWDGNSQLKLCTYACYPSIQKRELNFENYIITAVITRVVTTLAVTVLLICGTSHEQTLLPHSIASEKSRIWLKVTELEGRAGIPEPTLFTSIIRDDHYVHHYILVCFFLIIKTLAFYSGVELSVAGGGKRA